MFTVVFSGTITRTIAMTMTITITPTFSPLPGVGHFRFFTFALLGDAEKETRTLLDVLLWRMCFSLMRFLRFCSYAVMLQVYMLRSTILTAAMMISAVIYY